MVPALACIKWFDCHLPGAVVSQGISRPNAENCSGFPPPTRQSASIEAELLGLTSIYSELKKYRIPFRRRDACAIHYIVKDIMFFALASKRNRKKKH